jgi:hypothetical protein
LTPSPTRDASTPRRTPHAFDSKLLGFLGDKDSWDYATALFNSANQLRDRGDYAGAAQRIRRGLKEVIEGDVLLALVRAENHRSQDDARLAFLRKLGIATNSLAVLDDYIRNASVSSPLYTSTAFPPPWSLTGVDEGPPSDDELAPLGGEAAGFDLITQVYEPTDPARRLELAFCLAKNLRNPRIAKIHVLVESARDGTFASSIASLVDASKLHVQILGRRLRFSDAEQYAASSLPNRAVILCNADIFFDEDSLRRLGDAKTLDLDRRVLALLRWEWTCGFDITRMDLKTLVAAAQAMEGMEEVCERLRPRADSQDAWIFRAPLPALQTFDTELGRPRCDNRLAFVLGSAGYDVVNPAFALRPRHVQRVFLANGTVPSQAKARSYTSPDEARGSTRYVPLADQWVF